MKYQNYFLSLLLSLSIGAGPVLAINAPIVRNIPPEVDADTYTLTIYTEEGAKATVTGGPSQIAPVTDGAGDDLQDGQVEVMVGLKQNTVNRYSIVVEKNGEVSDSVIVELNEVSKNSSGSGDTTAPPAPTLNPIPEFVSSREYIITGTTEPFANIYGRTVEGESLGSSQADENGFFQFTVPLEENKTNRYNISAEDEAGNEGPATQAVIRMSVDLNEPAEPEPPKLETSAQQFFNDTKGHWAEAYINQLYQTDVVSGKSEGIFDPDGLITRAELTKIALLAFGHSVNTDVDTHPFSDVPRNSWFAPYVEEAKRLGFVSGYETGGFGPNDYVNRAAALKILLGAADVEMEETVVSFPDVPGDSWFADYIGVAKVNDIVSGYSDGNFHPERNITRAQVAKMVVKILNLKDSSEPQDSPQS
jgi:hypothetical protein